MTIDPEELEEYEIINYFEDDYKEYWQEQILRTDWEPAKELVAKLKDNSLLNENGQNSKLLMLTDGETLISYCFADENNEIKYLYTFESYRNNGCAKKLIDNL